MENFANFLLFSVLFSTKKVSESLEKLSELTFIVFVLYFIVYFKRFFTNSSGLRVQFRYLVANLRYIYVHEDDTAQLPRVRNTVGGD